MKALSLFLCVTCSTVPPFLFSGYIITRLGRFCNLEIYTNFAYCNYVNCRICSNAIDVI